MNSGTSGTEQTAEPDRENYAVLRKCRASLEGMWPAG
jgi:hypothetical protein